MSTLQISLTFSGLGLAMLVLSYRIEKMRRQVRWLEIQMAAHERWIIRWATLWDQSEKCCAGGPQWGHAWSCPKVP